MDSLGALVSQVLGTVQLAPGAETALPLLERLVGQTLEATLVETLPQGVRLQLADGQELLAQGQLPFAAGSLLTLKALPLPGGAGVRLQVFRATPPPTDPVLAPLAQGEAAPLLARLQSPTEALKPLAQLFQALLRSGSAETPETWSTWMKAVITTLAEPAASPREAPFHQLQAQEGTALFEIPLPWAPNADPLRLWVESDAKGTASGDATRRVFLSVPFSALGEVRMGVERSATALRARIWVEDPSRLDSFRPGMEAELAALGTPVTLQILTLPENAPDPRALAGGTSLSALG